MREYKPDKWAVIKLTKNDKNIYRILGSWSGGYLDGDSWRLSSGVNMITENDDCFIFNNQSGSRYICNKKSYGMNIVTSNIFEQLKDSASKLNYTVYVMDGEDVNLSLLV